MVQNVSVLIDSLYDPASYTSLQLDLRTRYFLRDIITGQTESLVCPGKMITTFTEIATNMYKSDYEIEENSDVSRIKLM